MAQHATHLIDEPPMLVYPSLAKLLGVNRAVVLQQLHWLLNGQKTSKNHYNLVDGRWWVYNSYKQWKEEQFGWLSPSSIKKIFLELEEMKLVLTMQSVKNPSDRRKWYTIDYEAWELFQQTMGQKVSHGRWDKKGPVVGQKMSDGYSKSTSKSTSKKTPLAQPLEEEKELPKRPDIFTVYEQNIGMLTGIISEALESAVEDFTYEWVKDAIEAAVKANVRRWSYAEAILNRWKVAGRDSSAPKPAAPAAPAPKPFVPEIRTDGGVDDPEEAQRMFAEARAKLNGGAQ